MKAISMGVVLASFLGSGAGAAIADDARSCARHHAAQGKTASSDHQAQVDARGDHVMGFDHENTTHHFRLAASGGAIEVTANRADDAASRDSIRGHLSHVAKMFAQGDFEAPMLIHDQVPPGVPVMKTMGARIDWKYEPIEQGGRIRISTKSPEALAAIHDFLRFQIADHRTGDAVEVRDEAEVRR